MRRGFVLGAFLFRVVEVGRGAAVDIGVQEGVSGEEDFSLDHIFVCVDYALEFHIYMNGLRINQLVNKKTIYTYV